MSSELLNASQDMFEDCDFSDLSHEESQNRTAEVAWRGVSLDSLKITYSYAIPVLKPSLSHFILFKVPIVHGRPIEPFPNRKEDFWDINHVRMPNSPKSKYPVNDYEFKQRWPIIIESLSQQIVCSDSLEAAILNYNFKKYQSCDLKALHTFFTNTLDEAEAEYFFESVLPKMIELALSIEQLFSSGIPLLKKHLNQSVSFSQRQIACLMANAFFCTFPGRTNSDQQKTYPNINFFRLFQCAERKVIQEKLKCFINYFRRVCSKCPDGVVTFSRRYVKTTDLPNWSESKNCLPNLYASTTGRIEDEGLGMMEIDFANKFVGGGIIGRGAVQEEIKFLICPELVISRLITECLDDTEALIVSGCERFNNFSGYADTFKWAGDFSDVTPRDIYGRRKTTVVAIDALRYSATEKQFSPEFIARDLNKAYVGFSFGTAENWNINIATGNWGCGVFRGDPELKFLLQLMAAGEARKNVAYFTFDNANLRDNIYNIYNFLRNNKITIGQIWKKISKYHISRRDKISLYDYLYNTLLLAESVSNSKTDDLSIEMDDSTADIGTILDTSLDFPNASLEPLPAETYSIKTEEGRKRCIETEKQRWQAYEVAKKELSISGPSSSVSPYRMDTNTESPTSHKPPPKRKISDYFAVTPTTK